MRKKHNEGEAAISQGDCPPLVGVPFFSFRGLNDEEKPKKKERQLFLRVATPGDIPFFPVKGA